MQDLEWMEFFTVHVIKFKTLSEALSMHDRANAAIPKSKLKFSQSLIFIWKIIGAPI
jgi:hypothetical protein